MRIGAFISGFLDRSLEEALATIKPFGITDVEIPAGGFFPKSHCHPAELLKNEKALEKFRRAIAEAGVSISAYAVHGMPLHPNKKIAEAYDDDFRAACALAEKTGVKRLTLVSGLPAGSANDQTPNWIVSPIMPEFRDCLRWQWEKVAIPYWREHGKMAEDHGVRLCFETVPPDLIYNPATLLRLREAVGPVIGCNLDISHLLWQGIDPCEAARELGDAIYHVHAKDIAMDEHVVRRNGVLDPKWFDDQLGRSWHFRTVGCGHGEEFWRKFFDILRRVGYDDVLSIEHEGEGHKPDEAFDFAVRFLGRVLIRRNTTGDWDA